MAKLPPKLNFERLRAEVEKLVAQRRAELTGLAGLRERTGLAGLAGLPKALDAAKRSPPNKEAKRSRRARRERVEKVVRELWPRGVPARSAAKPNRKLLSRLRPVLNKRGIHASADTMLRALGRRRDPKKKPMK
jgi:hypothetical protein